MKMKLIESPEEGLRTFSPATLKYLHWIISKLCALIESAPHGALVWYKLHFDGEGRKGAPSTQVESEWMRKLELWNCFEFIPSFQDIGQAMIVDRQHGEEIIEMFTKSLREDTDPERKFKQGWLSNYKLDSLKKYLISINKLLNANFSEMKGKMTFYINTGDIVYVGISGKKYEAKFGLKDNSYLLIKFLAQNPGKVFGADELVEHLKKPRAGGEDSTEDRRVRDTVSSIRDRLGLTRKQLKLTPKDDLFIVDKGFGFKCDVELKK